MAQRLRSAKNHAMPQFVIQAKWACLTVPKKLLKAASQIPQSEWPDLIDPAVPKRVG